MGHGVTVDLSTENRTLGSLSGKMIALGTTLAVLGLIGTLALGNLEGAFGGHEVESSGAAQDSAAGDGHAAADAGDHGPIHGFVTEWSIWHPYLVSACFFLTMTLGGLFFVLVHHITNAGWSAVVRRLAEGVSRNVVLMALIFIPLLFPDSMGSLYKWMHPDLGDEVIAVKSSYLNYNWFLIRLAIYFAIWITFAWSYHRSSVAQDRDGDVQRSSRMSRMSPVGVALFAMSVTFAGYDLLMSLDAHWFSTIFGVYIFAGCVLSFHALLALIVVFLQANGRLTRAISDDHMQDIGKMMFAFTVFWAYIAFSQYMLYWYANIPEETIWFVRRQSTWMWGFWGWVMVVGHFFVPFLFLVSKHIKRKRATIALGALWVLAMHWADMYYLVMPQISNGTEFPFTFVDITILMGMAGIFIIGLALSLRGHSLIAEKDPRMSESLAFENA
ncbi:MAG: quinol:cytochrome C oxidoreductase [bacterium]